MGLNHLVKWINGCIYIPNPFITLIHPFATPRKTAKVAFCLHYTLTQEIVLPHQLFRLLHIGFGDNDNCAKTWFGAKFY